MEIYAEPEWIPKPSAHGEYREQAGDAIGRGGQELGLPPHSFAYLGQLCFTPAISFLPKLHQIMRSNTENTMSAVRQLLGEATGVRLEGTTEYDVVAPSLQF